MKRFFHILLALLLLLSLAACQVSPENTEPTGTEPNATEPTQARYPFFPQLEEEKMALILTAWQEGARYGFPENMTFCDIDTKTDGIRYYDSFTGPDGTVYDIVYVPCPGLAVASQISISSSVGEGKDMTHTFRSRSGFGLYVFYTQHYEALDVTAHYFHPLADTEYASIPALIISRAAKLHSEYEKWFYGSELTELPEADPGQQLQRLQASYLMRWGVVPSFQEFYGPFYYGTYSGYDIVLEPTGLTWIEAQVIGNEEFVFGSSFILYAHKDGQFHKLKDIYEAGMISDEELAQIAQAHRERRNG